MKTIGNVDTFFYNEDTHQYFLNGVELPTVTKIISPLSDFSKVNPSLLERAGNYGKSIHTMIDLWFKGILDENKLDPLLKNSLEQFKKWWGNYFLREGKKILQVETPVYHKKLKYAGMPDIVFNDEIMDVKTRPAKKTDILQLVGYAGLVYPNLIGVRFHGIKLSILYLPLKGDYEYTLLADNQAWNMFRYLLDDYYYQEERLLKLNSWRGK